MKKKKTKITKDGEMDGPGLEQVKRRNVKGSCRSKWSPSWIRERTDPMGMSGKPMLASIRPLWASWSN